MKYGINSHDPILHDVIKPLFFCFVLNDKSLVAEIAYCVLNA